MNSNLNLSIIFCHFFLWSVVKFNNTREKRYQCWCKKKSDSVSLFRILKQIWNNCLWRNRNKLLWKNWNELQCTLYCISHGRPTFRPTHFGPNSFRPTTFCPTLFSVQPWICPIYFRQRPIFVHSVFVQF